jgi:hypothetical protein
VTRLQESISGAVAKVVAEEMVAFVASLEADALSRCKPDCNYCGNHYRGGSGAVYRPDTDAIAARLKIEMALA